MQLDPQRIKTSHSKAQCPHCQHEFRLYPLDLFKEAPYFTGDFHHYEMKKNPRKSMITQLCKFMRPSDPLLLFIFTAISVSLSGLYVRTGQISSAKILILSLLLMAMALAVAAAGFAAKRPTSAVTVILPIVFPVILTAGLLVYHHPVSALIHQVLWGIIGGLVMRILGSHSKTTSLIPLVLFAIFLFTPTFLWPLSVPAGVIIAGFVLAAVVMAIHSLFAPAPHHAAAYRLFIYGSGLICLVYLLAPTKGGGWVVVRMLLGAGVLVWAAALLEKANRLIWILPLVNEWGCRLRLIAQQPMSGRNVKNFKNQLRFLAMSGETPQPSFIRTNLWLAGRSVELHRQLANILSDTFHHYLRIPGETVSSGKTFEMKPRKNPIKLTVNPQKNWPDSGRAVYNFYGQLFFNHLNHLMQDVQVKKKLNADPAYVSKVTDIYMTALDEAVKSRDNEKNWQYYSRIWADLTPRGFKETLALIHILKLNRMHFEAIDLIDTLMDQTPPGPQRQWLQARMMDMEAAMSVRMGWGRTVRLDPAPNLPGDEKTFQLRIYNNTRDLIDKAGTLAATGGLPMKVWLEGKTIEQFDLEVDQGRILHTPPGQYQLVIYLRGITVSLLRTQWGVEESGGANLSLNLATLTQ
jgi:hypothetical protein